MCTWLRVVIADVRFRLAQSSCLISLVISRTVSSDFSDFSLILRTCEKSFLMTRCASSRAARPSCKKLEKSSGTAFLEYEILSLKIFIEVSCPMDDMNPCSLKKDKVKQIQF